MSRRPQSNFHCVKCGKSFKTQTWLQKHMAREHPAPLPSPKSAPVCVTQTVEKPKAENLSHIKIQSVGNIYWRSNRSNVFML